MISAKILSRKGALKAQDVSGEIKELLNLGSIESVNLMEWLSVNHGVLIKNVLGDLNNNIVENCFKRFSDEKKLTTATAIKIIGETILLEKNREEIFLLLSSHKSDSVRCWATYIIGLDEELTIEEKLSKIKPFAIDLHFGVREIAWMAVRNSIIEHLKPAISFLSTFSQDRNAYLRRFASESTRPKGVWCKHINELKKDPQLAISILEPLRSDESKYVQDSVGNWLNDAGKSQRDWVIQLCKKWDKASSSKHTSYIIKKALRNL